MFVLPVLLTALNTLTQMRAGAAGQRRWTARRDPRSRRQARGKRTAARATAARGAAACKAAPGAGYALPLIHISMA